MDFIIELDNEKYIFDGEMLCLFKNAKTEVEFNEANLEDVGKSITIMVSRSCNGKCKYCYEKQKDTLLNIDNAKKLVKIILEKHKRLSKLSFFGGEPLLAFRTIRYIVEEVTKYISVDSFEITTNAVCITDEIVDFLSRYNFDVIVSVDGPEYIHDYLREGCKHEIVVRNLEKLASGKIDTRINCTYTKIQEDKIGYDKLKEYFEKIGLKYTISRVITTDEKLNIECDPYYDIDKSIELLNEQSNQILNNIYVSNVIEAMVEHSKKELYCSKLETEYVIDDDCKIYSCNGLLEVDADAKKLKSINVKDNNFACSECWAKNLCSVCIADVYKGDCNLPEFIGRCKDKMLYEYTLKQLVYIYHNNPIKIQTIVNNFYN